MRPSTSANSYLPSSGSICAHETAAKTEFRLPANSLDQIGCMFSRLLAVLLPSSPLSAKNGLPSTINWVAVPCWRRWGAVETVWPWVRSAITLARHASVRQVAKVCRIRVSSWFAESTSGRHGDRLFELHVRGGRPEHDLGLPRLHNETVHGSVPVAQVAALERHAHGLRLARLQRDALEAAQFLDGPLHRRLHVLDVHLHHLIAGTRPCVLDIHADGNLSRALYGIGRRAQVGILEGGVTETESERIQGLPLEIHVGAAFSNVIVHHGRQIAQRLHPGGRQTPGRIVVAKQDVGQRVAFLLAVVRHVKDRGDILLNPGDGIWVEENV